MYLLKGLFREYVFIKGTVSEFQVTLEIMPTAQSMCVYLADVAKYCKRPSSYISIQ